MLSIKHLFLIIGCILLLPVLLYLYFYYHYGHICDSFDINEYTPLPEGGVPDEWYKTGDMILFRSDKTIIEKAFFGSKFTHIGIIHRCKVTNRVFVLDAGTGFDMGYVTLNRVRELYPGDVCVRRLVTPLSDERLDWLQETVNELFADQNTHPTTEYLRVRPKTAIFPMGFVVFTKGDLLHSSDNEPLSMAGNTVTNALTSCGCAHGLDMYYDSKTAVVCTDFIFVLLKHLDIIDPSVEKICIKPDFMAYTGNLTDLDTHYDATIYIIKDYLKRNIIYTDKDFIVINDFTHIF